MNKSLLIGSNLAILVGAYELARSGSHVTLLTDKKKLGGHFAGMHINGHDFDIGMVMLEKQTQDTASPNLQTYKANTRNDWVRFGHIAASWLDDQDCLRRVPTPTCLIQGSFVPDYLITNRLDVFADVDIAAPAPLSRNNILHAAQKTSSSTYDTLTYAEAARVNHGEALHSVFIEPYIRKSLGISSNDFLARYHRFAWAPLFYPETLTGALRGDVSLPEYPFWTTHNGFVGQLVKNLCVWLEKQSNVTLVNRPILSLKHDGQHWHANVSGGQIWTGERLALGIPPTQAHTLLGTAPTALGQTASVTLLFALVKASAIGRTHGCLMVVDENYSIYRLTDQDAMAAMNPEWHRVVVEARSDLLEKWHPALSPESILERELRSLMEVDNESNNAVNVLKCFSAADALAIPTKYFVDDMKDANARLSEATMGAILTGNLLGYGVSSFNDQLIQGLKIADEFS